MPAMSAARIITPPMSGGDRKHFARETHKAEAVYEHEVRAAAEAHAVADAARTEAYALDRIASTTRFLTTAPNSVVQGDDARDPHHR